MTNTQDKIKKFKFNLMCSLSLRYGKEFSYDEEDYFVNFDLPMRIKIQQLLLEIEQFIDNDKLVIVSTPVFLYEDASYSVENFTKNDIIECLNSKNIFFLYAANIKENIITYRGAILKDKNKCTLLTSKDFIKNINN